MGLVETVESLLTDYIPILFDINTVMAVLVAWILVHITKHTQWFKDWGSNGKRKRDETYTNQIRYTAIIITALCLVVFKRNDGEFDKLLNVIVFMAFASPFLYKGIILGLMYKFPKLTEYLSAKLK